MMYLGKEPEKLFEQKTVFVRVDFDVSFNADGSISDDLRIKRCLPTIEYLQSKGAKIVLGTKLGDPEKDGGLSCKVLLSYLRYLGSLSNLIFVEDYPGDEAKKAINALPLGGILLLENLRLYPQEKEDENFAKQFSNNFDFYVNEAFAMCHRTDTSVVLLPKYLPSFAGLNMAKEIEVLSTILENPQRPLVFIVGGAKIESKMPTINTFLNKADKIIIAGKLCAEPQALELAKNPKVYVAKLDSSGFDISKDSVATILSNLNNLGTIVWAGPLGKFEDGLHEFATKEVANAIAKSNAYKTAGGGDTISALAKFNLLKDFDFISTGGGAMLEFLAKGSLPGISALK